MSISYHLFCVLFFLCGLFFHCVLIAKSKKGGLDYRLLVIMLTKTTSFNKNESKLGIKGKRMFKNMEKCEKAQGNRYTQQLKRQIYQKYTVKMTDYAVTRILNKLKKHHNTGIIHLGTEYIPQ